MKVAARSNLNRLFQMLEFSLKKEKATWSPNSYNRVLNVEEEVGAVLRDETVRWLLMISDDFHLDPETGVLGATILDSFLCIIKARPKYLRCIAITSLFLAAKLLEEDEMIPSVDYIVQVTACPFSGADIIRMEKIILNKLDWNVRRITALDFIYILHAIIVCEYPNLLKMFKHMTASKQLTVLVRKLLMCQECADVTVFPPSTQALALISLELGLCTDNWFAITVMLQRLIKVENKELIQCREAMTAAILSRPYFVKKVPSSKRKVEQINEEDDIYDSIKRLYGDEDISKSCCKEAAQENIITHVAVPQIEAV